MKAVVYDKEKKLVLREVPMPEPGEGEVLIRVADCGFCGSDHSIIESGSLQDGVIVGHEVSGIAVEEGGGAQRGAPENPVIIRPTWCGVCRDCRAGRPYLCQRDRRTIGLGDYPGGFAEYLKVDRRMLIPVPEGVDSQNAALAEAFAASLHGIRVSGREGGSALVIGGGAIGLALVRLLALMGFGPIVLSEPVKGKRDLACSLGAHDTIDPVEENALLKVMELTGGCGFEAVFECSGANDAVGTAIGAAANGGTVTIVSIIMHNVEIMPLALNFKEICLRGSYSNTHEENIQCLQWMAEGKLDGRPLITDVIALSDLPRVYDERIHVGKAIKVMIAIGDEF